MITPHLVYAFLLTAAVAYLMLYAGLGKRSLEFRRSRRPCPSCGRSLRDCSCRL